MKKNIPAIAIVLIFASIIAAAFVTIPAAQDENNVCIRGRCFSVEVASSPQQQERGLMFRDSLGADAGMLFAFQTEGIYNFWMKNTLIPLDIIWIGSDNRIVSISANTQPCRADPCQTYGPGKPARYVLEINGGLSETYGFVEGDAVVFEFH
jgi:uncharacterized protein